MDAVFPSTHRASPPYDQRQWVRQYLALQAEIRLSSGGVWSGQTRDVSLLNLFVTLAGCTLEVGERGTVVLTAPSGKCVESPCTVIRTESAGVALDLHGWHQAHGLALTADMLELLIGISGAVSSSLDLQTTLKASVDHIRAYLQAEAASLFLVENDGRELVCRACSGPVSILGMRIPTGVGVVGKVVQERRARIVMDVAEDRHFMPEVDEETGFITRSLLCVPMYVNDEKVGALEVLNKRDGTAFDGDDQYLLSALAATAALAIWHARQAAELVDRERRKEELKLARAIQESFLPMPGAEEDPVHGVTLPALEISGDFFDTLTLADGRIFFALGDVSGKGARAGLLMARTSSLLRHLGRMGVSPGTMLRQVNLELTDIVCLGMFVTVVAGYYDPATGEVVLANAGHHPPMVHDVRGGGFRDLPGQDIPLGISARQEYGEIRLTLHDEVVYLYSDGATEAVISPDGEFLGLEGLRQLLAERRDLAPLRRLQGVVESIRLPDHPLHDDITLLVLDPFWRGAV